MEIGEWSTVDELLADLFSRPGLPQRLVDVLLLDRALLAAYRGDHEGAREALGQVSTETSKSANSAILAWYRRVDSVLFLLVGDLTAAFDEAIGAVDAEPLEGPNTMVAASFAGRAALWLRDVDRARQALARTPVVDKRWHQDARRALEAGVRALEGRPVEAAAGYEAVLAGRLAAGDPFTHALITLDAAAVLPDDLLPEGALAAARAYVEGLGANGLLSRFPQLNVRT